MTDLQDRSLGDLVTANFVTRPRFQRHGLYYCCRGRPNPRRAWPTPVLDATLVTAELSALAESGTTTPGPPSTRPHSPSTSSKRHHRYLWEELPLLDALAAKV